MSTRTSGRQALRRGLMVMAALAVVVTSPALTGVAGASGTDGLAASGGVAIVSSAAVSAPVADSPQAVQQRLVTLRYLPASAVTGKWDYRTQQAVLAFQAWEGLPRTGSVGPLTRAALAKARPPQPRQRIAGREIEVFRALGVTLLVDNGWVVRAVHSSSGKAGFTTPTGSYRVFRKSVRTWSHQYGVWLPYASFFNRGIAFHAAGDVPAYPASHGCIRLPTPDAPEVYAFAAISTLVVVY